MCQGREIRKKVKREQEIGHVKMVKWEKEVNWEHKKWNEEIEMGKERSVREKEGMIKE